jgi:hypothetical protein
MITGCFEGQLVPHQEVQIPNLELLHLYKALVTFGEEAVSR